MIWGWVPAFLWVTLGTVFFAGMHDLGALWASARNKGRSMGTLSGRYIGARGANLFLVVIFLLLLMVIAAFAVVIKDLLISTPSAVIPAWGAVAVALLVGQAVYRYRMSLGLVTVVGVAALYGLVLLGDAVPVELPDPILGMSPATFWIVALFVYAGIASLLPVWVLLQPRDYINGVQLFVGLGILFVAVLLSAPTVVAPAFNDAVPAGTPDLLPLLFVTIACGAISGFHGMVSSGTTSKQLDKETDARFVGYFGAVGEGMLALGAIIAAIAGYRTMADWKAVYTAFGEGGVGAFVAGGGEIVNSGLGLSASLSSTVLATMAILFAATTMDTGMRLLRFVVQEAGEVAKLKISNGVGTLIALAAGMGLTFSQGRRRRRRPPDLAAVRHQQPAAGLPDPVHRRGHADPQAPQPGSCARAARGRVRDGVLGRARPARRPLRRPGLAAADHRRRHHRRRRVGRLRGDRRDAAGIPGTAGGPRRRYGGENRGDGVTSRWASFRAGLEEFYAGPYRRTFARARREEDDLFRMVVLAEALGVPDRRRITPSS